MKNIISPYDYINLNKKPIFLKDIDMGNSEIRFANPNYKHLKFRHCKNNDLYVASLNGEDLGVLNEKGIDFYKKHYRNKLLKV